MKTIETLGDSASNTVKMVKFFIWLPCKQTAERPK